ncbi:hypothetical protein [Clostridium botulinum]|uniref:hypothetical protein n=1 Tax=Clostridium botulinum TaxID=1491 RepID=UPI0004D973CE|nr:hypothetical protein [Clostridium botulinum]KEH99807.1 putative filamentous hemagglutinin family outer membrane protein [Clostridium botulinum C/D str. BKT75002]KEI05285.1 putative filamentous hemagglutinin family outer membrane protein [Clostridium botulinum C/D str. BKT2873]QPW61977.1 hypothetical protein IG390_14065 [Clostridium botulinum]
MANGKFAGGDGSKENPFLIEDAFDLDKVRDNLNASYKLIRDIDLNIKPFNEGEGWKPIGGVNNSFQGDFDGDGHIIKNLYISVKNEDYIALFGYCSLRQSNFIKNLKIKDADIIGGNYVSALVGMLNQGNIECVCVIDSNIKSLKNSGSLIGQINNQPVTLKNSYSSNTKVESEQDDTGGLSSFIGSQSTIQNVYVCNIVKGKGCSEAITPRCDSEGNYGFFNCYYNIDNFSTSKYCTGKTTEQLKKPSTFKDWQSEKLEDQTPIWILKEGQYPKLWFEVEKHFLLNQSRHLYSIKNTILSQLDESEPTEELFKKDGFDDEQLLNLDKFDGQVEMKYEGKCCDGELFSYKIGDWIKNIKIK